MAEPKKTSKSINQEASAGEGQKKKKKKRKDDGTRETIESVAIAFILAFLFKTFQAEAYVIPTGSMAPTLYGRHKEVTCDGCGFSFALGASSEIDQDSGTLDWRLEDVYCSNCGKRNDAREASVFNGDRILVNKQVLEYKRFDVVVFKNPEQGHVNYIKRLVGLPEETIRIRKGDIWAKKHGEDEWKIQRKDDPFVQKDIQLTVYDDNYPAKALLELGWPERWEPSVKGSADGAVGGWLPAENAWVPHRDARTYECTATSDELQWLRYRHFLPDKSAWPDSQQVDPDRPSAEPTLIADFCAFNANEPRSRAWNDRTEPTGIYWTGDLTINAQVEVQTARANAAFAVQLVEGPQTFTCTIDLNTGNAVVTVVAGDDATGPGITLASGSTSMSGPDTYEITFANVDYRICLWVDGELVTFDSSGEYDSSDLPQPSQRDLAPCGLAFCNAEAVVSSLLLQRDIYYRNEAFRFSPEQGLSLYQDPEHEVRREDELQMLLHNPEAWTRKYEEEAVIQLEAFGRYAEYRLDSHEYLMFGDNSSMSKDGRLFDYVSRPMNGVFSHRYAVREQDLIGKALYIFWPHGIPFLNGGKGFSVRDHSSRDDGLDAGEYPSMRFPFYPDFSRMKKIR